MNLHIGSFADAGNISKERIVFKVLGNLDVGDYAVLRSAVGSSGEDATAGQKSAYWFPYLSVKAGDIVVLYSKKGKRSTKALSDGKTIYFFYWGKDEPLWGDGKYGAVLIESQDWEFKLPDYAPLASE